MQVRESCDSPSPLTAFDPAAITARARVGGKTRVRGFELGRRAGVWGSTLGSVGKHRGNSCGYDRAAADHSKSFSWSEVAGAAASAGVGDLAGDGVDALDGYDPSQVAVDPSKYNFGKDLLSRTVGGIAGDAARDTLDYAETRKFTWQEAEYQAADAFGNALGGTIARSGGTGGEEDLAEEEQQDDLPNETSGAGPAWTPPNFWPHIACRLRGSIRKGRCLPSAGGRGLRSRHVGSRVGSEDVSP